MKTVVNRNKYEGAEGKGFEGEREGFKDSRSQGVE
jgi:hypothetical protein